MKKQINQLLTKKMNRKEFLKSIGMGVVAVAGADTVLKTLSSMGQEKSSSGYGSGSYGG